MNQIPLAKFQLAVTFCVVIVASSISMGFVIVLKSLLCNCFCKGVMWPWCFSKVLGGEESVSTYEEVKFSKVGAFSVFIVVRICNFGS